MALVIANYKFAIMRKVHLVVRGLFLPTDIAAEVCADLRLKRDQLIFRSTACGYGAAAKQKRKQKGSL